MRVAVLESSVDRCTPDMARMCRMQPRRYSQVNVGSSGCAPKAPADYQPGVSVQQPTAVNSAHDAFAPGQRRRRRRRVVQRMRVVLTAAAASPRAMDGGRG
jgi:hypothetical protein